MYKNFHTFIFIFLILEFCQAQKNNLLDTSSDYGAGVFTNFGSDGFEVDGYVEADLFKGLFFELGISQIDFDEESLVQIAPSFGFAYQFKNNISMGLGYSLYTDFENTGDNDDEIFLGSILGPITGIISYDINTKFFNYLFIVDLNFGPFKSLPVSLSSYNYIEDDNFDFNFRFEKNLYNNLNIGYIISRERYDYEPLFQSKTKGKNYNKYGNSLVSKDEAFFHTFYLGLIF